MESSQWENRNHLFYREVPFLTAPQSTFRYRSRYEADLNIYVVALKEEETLLQDGTIDTGDVESKDNFVLLMSQITCCIAMAICVVS
jgi:hypothetical protein